MQFQKGTLFHIYNRGNNRQTIFFERENYLYFLFKVRKYLLPHCEILSYCLMPNHFHLLIYADERTMQTVKIGNNDINVLSYGFQNLLSSYTKAINRKFERTGSLFTQNTKAKALAPVPDGYICLKYIHQNPLKAGLVRDMNDWEFSSFQDYAGIRNGSLCNQTLANQLLSFDKVQYFKTAYEMVLEDDAKRLF
jgi:putative transposase